MRGEPPDSMEGSVQRLGEKNGADHLFPDLKLFGNIVLGAMFQFCSFSVGVWKETFL